MKKLSILLIAAGLFAFSCGGSEEGSTETETETGIETTTPEENTPETNQMPEDTVVSMDTTKTDAGGDTPE